MRAVNLLPREVEKTKTSRLSQPVVTGVIVGGVVVALLAIGFVRESASVSHKRTELEAARTELALIPAPVPDSTSSTLAGQRAARIAALQSALSGRVAWDRVLREISLVVPENVWLVGLTLQAPVQPATVVPTPGSVAGPPPPTSTPTYTDFTMNGKAFSHDGVARLLSRLALLPDLDHVALGHSTRVTGGTRDFVEFTVTAGIRAPGAPQ
jgi:Tfp pilus assembly protein PilN